MIGVSIVSHGHGAMVEALLADLVGCPEVGRIILTLNVPEKEPAVPTELAGRILFIRNETPKGFGANHNAAFARSEVDFFCVLNPDVRIPVNPFPVLLSCMSDGIALSAPAVTSPAGLLEDSARRFPGVSRLFAKLLGLDDGRYSYNTQDSPFHPDWVGGMFMLVRSVDYAALGGFDEGYFLYYEDVDLCVRLWRFGRQIVLCPQVAVVHAAQRASHRNFRHLAWHLKSMLRYFLWHWGRLPVAGNRGR